VYIGIYMSLGIRHDFTTLFKKISIPILVIHGEQDFLAQEGCESFSRLFSRSDYNVIEKASHFSFNENPKAIAHLINKWLN